jgi:hypothetical protein
MRVTWPTPRRSRSVRVHGKIGTAFDGAAEIREVRMMPPSQPGFVFPERCTLPKPFLNWALPQTFF